MHRIHSDTSSRRFKIEQYNKLLEQVQKVFEEAFKKIPAV